MAELDDLGLREIGARLRDGRLTALALAEHAIARHERFGAALGAYIHWDPEALRTGAKAADALFAAGVDLGPLQGVPVSVKDLFGVRGMPTQAGSPKRLPARFEEEGSVVRAVRKGGGVVTGKTHTVEFAYEGLGVNPHLGSPRNPWDAATHRCAGGSSSGAGVSLIEGSALVALGSDSGGSVRMPATVTGTVGLKPGHGRWGIDGIVPFCPTLDSPGPLTRTVDDAAVAFAAIDPHCDRAGFEAALAATSVADARLGLAETHFWADCDPGIAEGVRAALGELEGAGASLRAIDFPEAVEGYAEGMRGHIVAAEFHALMRAELPDWLETLNPILKERLEVHERPWEIPAVDYYDNLRAVRALQARADERLRRVDAIVCPTVVMTPPPVAEIVDLASQRGPNLRIHNNAYLVNILGLSALTMPVALDAAGMPVGLQLIARSGNEERLLALACAFERTLGTARRRLGVAPMCVST
ncbi:MAG: amidase [Rhodospirillaceae bacterium]|jgi:aspartyl-tRNA(Asn)/glutamyl-tRNA(Gln) amidotransferase subunit A|nr:amidase [Rhodospirillaceae bacterium]